MPMQILNYTLLPTPFGTLGMVWQSSVASVKVQRVFLPSPPAEAEGRIVASYAGSKPASCPPIDELCQQVGRFLQGQAVQFDMQVLALDQCSPFQRRVLLAESQIPRGWVSTYGRIAKQIACPGGARAVGRALANNPFPIIIPCHRAIRSHGSLGGFQGGLGMKRALLQLEGVEFSGVDRVVMNRVYY
jgi:methylated-DNA-[protein]-cysteine S-methyltransferase